jgi:hypothetical protein
VGARTTGWLPGGLPLSERPERAFAARASDLPETTRLVLLVAALDDEDAVSEILQAASVVAGSSLDLDAAAPAAENTHIFDFDLATPDMEELDALDRSGGTREAIERKWW